jgi:hypothetical protein
MMEDDPSRRSSSDTRHAFTVALVGKSSIWIWIAKRSLPIWAMIVTAIHGRFVSDIEDPEFARGFLAPAKGDGGGRQGPDFRFFLHTTAGRGVVVAGLSVFLNEVIAQKLEGGLPVLYKGRKLENDAGDKVGIGLRLDGNSHFHAANHKDGLDQAFLEPSAREFRTSGFAEAGKCGFGLGDGHTPFDVPKAIRIALAIEVLRLAREQRQRDRREEKKPHYLSMSDLNGFR